MYTPRATSCRCTGVTPCYARAAYRPLHLHPTDYCAGDDPHGAAANARTAAGPYVSGEARTGGRVAGATKLSSQAIAKVMSLAVCSCSVPACGQRLQRCLAWSTCCKLKSSLDPVQCGHTYRLSLNFVLARCVQSTSALNNAPETDHTRLQGMAQNTDLNHPRVSVHHLVQSTVPDRLDYTAAPLSTCDQAAKDSATAPTMHTQSHPKRRSRRKRKAAAPPRKLL